MPADTPPLDENDTLATTSAAALQPSRSKRWFVLAPLLGLVVVAGGYAGVQWWIYSLHHVSTDDARVKGHLITVSSKVPGRLLTLAVEDGSRITKGEIMAQLEQAEYQAQVSLREAALAAAQSQLGSAEADLELTRATALGSVQRSDAVLGVSRSQLSEAEKAAVLGEQQVKANLQEKEAAVEETKARLTGARATLDKAEADLKRAEQLFRDGVVSTEQRDQAAATADLARAQYQTAQEALNRNLAHLEMARAESKRVPLLLDNVQTQQRKVRESEALKTLATAEWQRVRMKEETVKNLRAKVQEAEAQLDLARLHLTETTITSPINGTVSQTIADPGEYLQPGQPLVIVNDPQDVWVEANIEETQIGKVRIGQPVTIKVDAYPHLNLRGSVAQLGAATRSEFAIIPAGSASAHFIKVTQRLPVRIAVENNDGLLKPGMMVVVGIRVQ